ncbi:hypothetical protein Kpho02_76200 [Kitasatospora phosalacinea]|uniref:Uncharacterized protein n=1 Tax=Kitasatospora phosalacinea TaxID=2065 RepID=A0A9W6QIA2_9ACTN|nr:hypothetical protein [Kitasatospora phosalacinea]GLW75323.1 hypothetical protein Kpho02_76200 [Kitasatospora phosalacinea]
MATATEPTTRTPRPQDQLPPTQTRWMAGARHTSAALTHWAGGHTIGAEELTRRIVKARLEAHKLAGAQHTRQAQIAHNKATKLHRRAQQNGGLVAADQSALVAAERDAAYHDSAFKALGEFEVPELDPGQIRHRRHRTAVARCFLLALPVNGILAASWYWSGTVFLVATTAALLFPLVRGDRPFDLTIRPVPAALLAATPMVEATTTAASDEEEEDQAVPADADRWREELLLYVEHSVSVAHLDGRKGVHTVDLLVGLQAQGRYLGVDRADFPERLRAAGIPVRNSNIKGTPGLAVRYDELHQALKRFPRLPPNLATDYTEDEEEEPGESPSPNPSPGLTKAQ